MRKTCPTIEKLASGFSSTLEAKDIFRNVLQFEAYHALQKQITDFSEPLLCCVDLDTDNPGIVTKYISENELSVTYLSGNEQEYTNIFELRLFSSPIPFDRHINALCKCEPNKFIENIVLNAKETKITVNQLKEICKENKLKVSGLKNDLINRLKENFVYPQVVLYHGPPGTGKTYTSLNLLKNMLEKLPTKHRFFICAPSNVGTMNMYIRAKDFGIKGSLVMREDKIPDGSNISDEEKEAWNHKTDRVVFSTISGRCGSNLRKEEFHTIIVDEAAQCQEAWIWGLLRKELINLIMAGDPHQLPAQVCDEGKEMGHGISMMERLMKIGYNSILLNTQRRMHPTIANFPNINFYEGKLLTEFTNDNNSLKPYEIIGINSKEEKKGTSFYNEIEAKVVVSLANKLRQTYKDTIIISPYKGQCEYLKKLDPTLIIHTVDSFQGKEADAIILTTVRSGKSIGFWQDCRRLNVALTRAKNVLRIVGCIPAWKNSNSIMSTLANDAYNRSYVKQLTPSELIQLNINLKLSDLQIFFQTSKWKNPIIDSRALNNARSDIIFENALSKALVKICNGMKFKTNNLVYSLDIDKCTIDWSVVIDESTKETKIKIHNIRYKGNNMQIVTELHNILEKNGPEWNEVCSYSKGPTVLDELPFKGKRPIVPIKEPKRDYFREKAEAQRLVASFMRSNR
jgi:hypothetical protein